MQINLLIYRMKTVQEPRQRLWLLAYAFIVGIIYDLCVRYGGEYANTSIEPHGVGMVVAVGATLVVGGILFMAFNRVQSWWPLVALLPIGVLCASVLMYSNRFVVYAVPAAIVILLLFMAFFSTLQKVAGVSFSLRNIPWLKELDGLFEQLNQIGRDLTQWRSQQNRTVVRIGIGVAISIPILVIFALLFAAADEIFAQTILNIFAIDMHDVWRLIRTLFIAVVVGSIIYQFVNTSHTLRHKEEKIVSKPDTVIVTTVLTLINVLFASFVVIQLRYFFGDAQFVFEQGLTYAEYVHRGFGELIAVVLLAATLLLLIHRFFSHHKTPILLTVLQLAFIIQVSVVAYSALGRMDLYQEMYGFTVLRLYVEWFIYFIMAVLLLSGISLVTKLRFQYFFYSIFGLGVVAFCAVALVNVDGMIAKKNVDRYINEGKSLDMRYLMSDLSMDAAPEIRRAVNAGIFNDPQYKEQTAEKMKGALVYPSAYKPNKKEYNTYMQNLQEQLQERKNDWRLYHIGLSRIDQALFTTAAGNENIGE